MTLGCAIASLTACGASGSTPKTKAQTVEPASSPIGNAPSSAAPSSIPTATPKTTEPASTPIIKIAVFGTDDMAGYSRNAMGMPSIVTPNGPQDLQSLLQTKLDDTGVTVENHATGGTSSSLKNELAGLDGNGAPFAQRIQSSPAAIVVDNHAVNDMYDGESVNDYAGYLGQWIEAVRAENKTPVLEEPNPVCDGDHPQLAAYASAMDTAAQQYGVAIIRQYQPILALPDWESHMDASCRFPDAILDQFKAQQEYAALAPMVQNLIGSRK